MTTNTNTATYELVVTRVRNADDLSTFTAFIYRLIPGGICGPITDEYDFEGMGDVIEWIDGLGYATHEFPKVNGKTATYPLVVK